MQVQIPFSKIPMFSPSGSHPEGESKLICSDYPTWGDFGILCVLLAISQEKQSHNLELTKKEILDTWGKTCQGKNYILLEGSLKKWSNCRLVLEGKEIEIIKIYSYEKKNKLAQVELGKDFFQSSLDYGKVWDLKKVLSMNSVVFRLVQIISGILFYKPIGRFKPISLAKQVAITANKPHIARKRIRAKMCDVMDELREMNIACSESWEKVHGDIWLYISRNALYAKAYDEQEKPPPTMEIKKAVKVAQPTTAKIFSYIPEQTQKEERESSLSKKENTTTNTRKSQVSFEDACSFYESISSDFDRGSLRNYAESVVNNWEFHKEAIKFCCPGQLPTRSYSGRKICGWYKSGAQKGEFSSYVEEKNKELAKKRAEEQTPELKKQMFSTVINLLKSCSDEGKKELARQIENDKFMTNVFDAEKEFNSLAINKCLESTAMSEYRKPGYSDLINSLFLWNEFGKVMKAELPKNWWPTLNLKHEIKREDKPPLRAVDKEESLFKKQINAAERLKQAMSKRVLEESHIPASKEVSL